MVSSIRTPQSEESFSIPHSAFRIPHSTFHIPHSSGYCVLSACSIASWKALKGCAPERNRPFTTNAGVPFTPTRLPSATSLPTAAAYVPLSRQTSNCDESSLRSAANFFRLAGSSTLLLANNTSWYSQYFPCAPAQREASAAFWAF